MDYSTPQYAHSWLPIRYFKDFGDEENFFIQLEYVINKINYSPQIHKELDFDMLAANGEKIFCDLDSDALEELKSRNYVLLKSTETPTSNFNDRFYVQELYGYAPSCEFQSYSDDVVLSPQLLLPDGLGISCMPNITEAQYNYYANSLSITPPSSESNESDSSESEEITEEEKNELLDGAGDLLVNIPASKTATITGGCCNACTGMVEFQIDNEELASVMKKGALVFFYGKGRVWGVQWWYYFLTGTAEIAGKIGNKFYIIPGNVNFIKTGGNGYWTFRECFYPNQTWFGEKITLYFLGNVRDSRNIQCRTITKVKFYLERPPLSDFKSPIQIDKSQYTTTALGASALTDMSNPTASEWIEKAQNGENYVLNGSKLEYRDGLYTLSTTYAPYC